MSEAVTIESTGLKGTAFFERKVNDGDYGSNAAGLYVQFDIPADAGDAQILADARDAFVKAKASVLEQLGIPFVVNEDGVVSEVSKVDQVKAVFPGAQVENAPAPAAVPAAGGSAWYGKRGKAVIVDGVDLWDVLADSPEAFYDNRENKANGSYKPNSPDFKHKDSGKGLWQS